MAFKYGNIITLKDGVKPQMSLDEETFFSLVDDEDCEIKTYWSLPAEAFETDMGSVYLKSEYAKKLRWGVDAVTDADDDGHKRLNINVAYDPDGDVNCGAFCSWIDEEDVEVELHEKENDMDNEKRVDEREQHINNVLNLIGTNEKQIDVFKLHGLLFIGNVQNGEYDLHETYTMHSEHSLPMNASEFEDCETDEEIKDKFGELLSDIVADKLV